MIGTVAERGKYFYHYSALMYAQFLLCFFSCCCKEKEWFKRRQKRMERHEIARKKLMNELDLRKILTV